MRASINHKQFTPIIGNNFMKGVELNVQPLEIVVEMIILLFQKMTSKHILLSVVIWQVVTSQLPPTDHAGTTPNIEQIFKGRCVDYLSTKYIGLLPRYNMQHFCGNRHIGRHLQIYQCIGPLLDDRLKDNLKNP